MSQRLRVHGQEHQRIRNSAKAHSLEHSLLTGRRRSDLPNGSLSDQSKSSDESDKSSRSSYSPPVRRSQGSNTFEMSKSTKRKLSHDLSSVDGSSSNSSCSSRWSDKKRVRRELASQPFNDKKPVFTGLSAQDYRNRLMSTLQIYKYLTAKDGHTRPVHKPFLTRNLLYVSAPKPPTYIFGETEAPLMFRPCVSICNKRSEFERKQRLESICAAVKDRDRLMKEIEVKENIRDYSFCAETLSNYRRLRREALLYDRGYRKFLESNGKPLPPIRPIATIRPMIRKSNSPTASVITTSMKFSAVRHNLLGGERSVRIQPYLCRQNGKRFSPTRLMESATFMMPLNIAQDPIAIDLPYIGEDFAPKGPFKLHLVLKVLITDDKAAVNVEGRSLRATPGRHKTSPGSESNGSSRLRRRDSNEKFTVCMYGTRCLYAHGTDDIEGDGYLDGDASLVLIEEDLLNHDYSDPRFIAELDTLSKKLHSNPFVQMAVVTENLSDSESDLNDSKISANGAAMENGVAARLDVVVASALNAYCGRYGKEEGRYVNDVKIVERLWGESLSSLFSSLTTKSMLQRALNLNIGGSIAYQIYASEDPSDKKHDEIKQEPCGQFSLLSKQTIGWVTTMQTTEPDRCIVCNRKCENVYELLMHYHLSYPRLAFLLHLDRDSNIKGGDSLRIRVCLDPNFDDCLEIHSVNDSARVAVTAPVYLWTRDLAKKMRKNLRWDLMIFSDFINTPQNVSDHAAMKNKFVEPSIGRIMHLEEDIPLPSRLLPAKGSELTHMLSIYRIEDYIDVSDDCKKFMSAWNEMVLHLGNSYTAQTGIYMLGRIFLHVHSEWLHRDHQGKQFLHLIEMLLDKGLITKAEQIDLASRFQMGISYDPLVDPASNLHRNLTRLFKKGNQKYRQVMENPKSDLEQKRNLNKLFRNDPTQLKPNARYDLLKRGLSENLLPKSDRSHRLSLDPIEVVFEGKLPSFFNNSSR